MLIDLRGHIPPGEPTTNVHNVDGARMQPNSSGNARAESLQVIDRVNISHQACYHRSDLRPGVRHGTASTGRKPDPPLGG
jgi:hypothetical protein